jgi:hypothetical protein
MYIKEWASISNHQENANQTHKEISPQSMLIVIIKKAKSNKYWHGYGETVLYTADMNIK